MKVALRLAMFAATAAVLAIVDAPASFVLGAVWLPFLVELDRWVEGGA